MGDLWITAAPRRTGVAGGSYSFVPVRPLPEAKRRLPSFWVGPEVITMGGAGCAKTPER
jgi:hypothetical protein